jgi:hypothetical protein
MWFCNVTAGVAGGISGDPIAFLKKLVTAALIFAGVDGGLGGGCGGGVADLWGSSCDSTCRSMLGFSGSCGTGESCFIALDEEEAWDFGDTIPFFSLVSVSFSFFDAELESASELESELESESEFVSAGF